MKYSEYREKIKKNVKKIDGREEVKPTEKERILIYIYQYPLLKTFRSLDSYLVLLVSFLFFIYLNLNSVVLSTTFDNTLNYHILI